MRMADLRGVSSSRWARVHNHHQVDEFVHRQRRQPVGIQRDVEDRRALFLREAAREVGLELLDQHRDAFLAPAAVADRIFDDDFLRSCCRP